VQKVRGFLKILIGSCLSRHITALRISSGRTRELARADGRLLQPLDGRREAPDIKWMVICSADGTARSVRAIIPLNLRQARVGLNSLRACRPSTGSCGGYVADEDTT
jgi:hypothetical protein